MLKGEEVASLREKVKQSLVKEESDSVKPVTDEESLRFQQYYLKQLGVINLHLLKLPNRVLACASCFFKRFYLVHSIHKFHPKYERCFLLLF